MTPVKSSNIKAVGYDPASRALTVQFATGDTHRYANVPPHVHSGMIAADSVGGYFHKNVKSAYDSRKL